MAFYCQCCNTRNPNGDTKIIFLEIGHIEFCPTCGDRTDLIQVPGRPEIDTLNKLFNMEETDES